MTKTAAVLGTAGRPGGTARPDSNETGGRSRRRARLLLVMVLIASPNLIGVPYYLLSIAQRVRHPLHPWFKPSGYVGQSAGILTLVLFLFMYLYPARKRFRFLSSFGAQGRWLEVHIASGLIIPIVGAMHAGWRFQGLIGLGYFAMLMVSLSGIAGRYIYTRIPRARSGLELTEQEVVARQRELEREIARVSGLPEEQVRSELATRGQSDDLSSLSTIRRMFANDLNRWRTVRRVTTRWGSENKLSRRDRRGLARAVRERMALGQQRRMLVATRRLFGYWHVIHRPFSVTSFAAVVVHVVVVVSLGVTWF